MVKQFNDGIQARVQDNDETSEPFPVTNGVKQGRVLAPSLFSLIFSAMLTDAFRDGDIGIGIRFRMDGKMFNLRRLQAKTKVLTDIIRECLFADKIPDTELFAHAGLPSIHTILMQARLRWAGHEARMPDHRLPKDSSKVSYKKVSGHKMGKINVSKKIRRSP